MTKCTRLQRRLLWGLVTEIAPILRLIEVHSIAKVITETRGTSVLAVRVNLPVLLSTAYGT